MGEAAHRLGAVGAICGRAVSLPAIAFQTAGLRFTTAPKSAFLTGLSTCLVPFLAALVYQIRPRAPELLGVALAITGMGLMTLQGAALAMSRRRPADDRVRGGLCRAHRGAGALLGPVSFELLSPIQVAVAAVLALGTVRLGGNTAGCDGARRWLRAMLITGLLATALAFTVQSWAQQYTSATRTALIFTLEPVFAWGTSFVAGGGEPFRACHGRRGADPGRGSARGIETLECLIHP